MELFYRVRKIKKHRLQFLHNKNNNNLYTWVFFSTWQKIRILINKNILFLKIKNIWKFKTAMATHLLKGIRL